ncbi:MAG: hypothetical protein R3B91_04290 [Planctomycetaceae bacterium]
MTVLICGCLANTSAAQSPEYDTSTYTYKRVGLGDSSRRPPG